MSRGLTTGLGFQGLVTEICEAMDIPDINDNGITVGNIKKAVFTHHQRELLENIERSKKMMKHKGDNFSKPQSYMNERSVERARMSFRIRSEMVQEVRGNYKDKYRRKGGEQALLCQEYSCGVIETQSHCLECPKWESLRLGLDVEKLEDMVIFFQKLLSERTKKHGS